MKLTLNNLNKCYKDKVAVKDISFEVNDGETIGILGLMEQEKQLFSI